MVDPQSVIDESRPMLEELLINLQLHHPGDRLDLSQVLDPFSSWVDAQEVTNNDQWWLAARLGAFICEYLIDHANAKRVIEGRHILVRMPIQEGVLREFDPYAVAVGLVKSRSSLASFLHELCNPLHPPTRPRAREG